MSVQKTEKPVFDILTNADSFPYIPPVDLTGIAIVNDGTDILTVIVNDGEKDIEIRCTIASRAYEADFRAIKSINVTSGSIFQIELRSVL
jgi:hypothetical protein